MLKDKSREYREGVRMGEGTVLGWVARDQLTEITPSVGGPAGNNWHIKVSHWRRVRRMGRMKGNYRASGVGLLSP